MRGKFDFYRQASVTIPTFYLACEAKRQSCYANTLCWSTVVPEANHRDIDVVERENVYLKQRCALLEDDVSDLTAQVTRLGQQIERLMTRREGQLAQPNPLAGGQ